MFLRCNVLSTMSYSFFLIPLPYWFLADRKRIFSVMTKKKNSKIMEQPQVFFFSLIIMITLPGFRGFLVLWQKSIQRLWNNCRFFFFSIDDYHFAWFQRNFSVMTKKNSKIMEQPQFFCFHWLLWSLCLVSACLVLCVVPQYCAKARTSYCY